MNLQQVRAAWPARRLDVGGQGVEIIRTSARVGPVILLPGAQGTGEVFYRQLAEWGERRDMVALTLPALTDPVALAGAVVACADALGLDTFDVIGSSLGGYVAQWLAVLHAPRLGRVVIGNSFQDPGPSQSPEKLAAVEGKPAATLKAEALARLDAAPASDFREVMLDLVGRHQPADVLRARMLAVQKATPVPPLAVEDGRLLLIECDNDPLISPPMREAIRAAYPGASHQVVAGGGHYPHMLQPAAYNACVAAFLDIQ